MLASLRLQTESPRSFCAEVLKSEWRLSDVRSTQQSALFDKVPTHLQKNSECDYLRI